MASGEPGDCVSMGRVSRSGHAPAFQGDAALQDEFLGGIGVDYRQEWLWEDTLHAHEAWDSFVQRKRGGQLPKRPLADILIGAFALRYRGLITRNPDDFKSTFPALTLRGPLHAT